MFKKIWLKHNFKYLICVFKKMKEKYLIGGVIAGGISVCGFYWWWKRGELFRDIKKGASIMGLQSHPDDCEAFTPGAFIMAGGDAGNNCWIVSVIPIHQINSDQQEARAEAIAWFEENYLEEYLFLDGRPLIYDHIKSQLISIIEEKKPDILLTFTPFGWNEHPEHIMLSAMITDIWDELSYNPKIYWFIAAGQCPSVPSGPYDMRGMYPPTSILNLDKYSNVLGKTFWEAKLEVYEHYRSSVPGIDACLNESIQNNNRKEYFRRKR